MGLELLIKLAFSFYFSEFVVTFWSKYKEFYKEPAHFIWLEGTVPSFFNYTVYYIY